MAEERKMVFFLRPRFLLFCMYLMIYAIIRSNGEIVYQAAPIQGGGIQHIVGTNPSTPRWRRQLYRVFFSPVMVAEEEGRRLVSRGRRALGDAEQYGRGLF